MHFDYTKYLIYLGVAGSRAYGTFNPDSDWDYRGVIIPPQFINDSFIHSFEQKEGLEGYGNDSVAYDIRKYFKLAAECNPNVLEILWLPDQLITVNTEYGEAMRSAKKDFLSQRAKHRFHGYAYAQLKRIKQHKKWWDQEKSGSIPPKPERKSYGLNYKPKFGKDKLSSLISIPSSSLSWRLKRYIAKERRYAEDKQRYDKWRQWKENRNPARAELEARYGYDSKHAMHLVRLMIMCEEILQDEEVIVQRPDAEFLKSIRNGAWSYEKLMDWVEKQDKKLDTLAKTTKLPKTPNLVKLNKLCADLVEKARRKNFSI